jgi:hypothetical protein
MLGIVSLKRALLPLAGSILIAATILPGSDQVLALGARKPVGQPPTVSVSVSVAATADAANGSVRINSVSRGATIRLGAAPAIKYTCIIETQRHSKVKGYKPLTVHNGGRSHSMTWLLSPYSVKHARFLQGPGYTFQVEMCMVGAGHSWNYWHQWFDGGAIVLRYTRPLMIGNKWGTGVVDGNASATLSFQLSKGAASIGGSTQVKNYGSHSGDTGEDDNLNLPKKWRKYNINRVNAFYISSHDFFYQGTGSNEGNVGHALYEFDTKSSVNFQYGAAIQVRAFCAESSCPAGF